MTQPSFEYLEDKKVLRQVPDSYPTGGYAPGNYTCKCAICHSLFTGDKRAVHCEPCAIASLPTYPVTTPTEQWEREVRGRKDLKEGVDFTLEDSELEKEYYPNGEYTGIKISKTVAIPIFTIQEEVKKVDEEKVPSISVEQELAACKEHIKELKQGLLDLAYCVGLMEGTIEGIDMFGTQVNIIGIRDNVQKVIKRLAPLLNSDQNPERSVASKAK